MTTYRVTFIYGTRHLWADIECPHIAIHDRRGFADLAQLAVNNTLDNIPSIERTHIAHDYAIFELSSSSLSEHNADMVCYFDTLKNE